uniref:Uncharacterized protein n=1 Tax=Strix occidentalis caurina TaxID=311401 RepID=A0A8D0EVH4_STROC
FHRLGRNSIYSCVHLPKSSANSTKPCCLLASLSQEIILCPPCHPAEPWLSITCLFRPLQWKVQQQTDAITVYHCLMCTCDPFWKLKSEVSIYQLMTCNFKNNHLTMLT